MKRFTLWHSTKSAIFLELCKRTCFILCTSFILTASWLPVYAESPQDTLKRYVSELQRNPSDRTLREKIIRHAQTMKPAPLIPEEAKKHMARGIAAEGAKSDAEYRDAVAEFEKVIAAAPWVGEGYRNLGIAQDKVAQYDKAIENLNFYLLTNPQDADKAKDMIYKIEYRKEKVQKEIKVEEDRKAENDRRQFALVQGLAGTWTSQGGGMQYYVTMSGNSLQIKLTGQFVDNRLYPREGWSCQGAVNGATINGTCTMDHSKVWTNATVDTDTMNGRIGSDGKSIHIDALALMAAKTVNGVGYGPWRKEWVSYDLVR